MAYSEQLEDIIQNTGGCGIYQYLSTIIFHWAKIVAVWNYHFMTFNGQVPDMHCTSTTNETNARSRDVEEYCHGLCDNVTYDADMVNMVSEWNLVCGQEWIPTIIFTILLLGATTGACISGPIADRIGRKPVVFCSILCIVIFNLISAFSISSQMYAVLQFFTGVVIESYLNVGTIIMVEYAPRTWRAWVILFPSWAVGASSFALVAWSLHDWRKMHLTCAVVAFPILLTVCFIQESARWMLAKKKVDAAGKTIRYIAKINRAIKPDLGTLHVANTNNNDESGVMALFRDYYLLKLTTALWIIWFSSYLTFFGFTFGVKNISGDLYMNMFLLNVVDIPISLISPVIINKFGRKWISTFAYITSGALAFIIGIFKCYDSGVDEEVIRVVAFVAKAFTAMCTQILTVYTLELYPTVVRSTALGCHIAASDIATVIVPLLIRMDQNTPGLLYFLSGILMVLSAVIIVSFLRETKDLALEETFSVADKSRDDKSRDKVENNYHSIE